MINYAQDSKSLTSCMGVRDEHLEEFLGPCRELALLLPLGEDEVVVPALGDPGGDVHALLQARDVPELGPQPLQSQLGLGLGGRGRGMADHLAAQDHLVTIMVVVIMVVIIMVVMVVTIIM